MVLHEAETGLPGSVLLKRVRSSDATVVFLTERADAVALHLAARDAGLRLPRDLSMVVLGSHVRSPNAGIAFTTYHIPREEMGRRATQALVTRLEGGGTIQELLTCSIDLGETLADLSQQEDAT
jgi:DNA-binding LacI/PurR family transcriptional regulator